MKKEPNAKALLPILVFLVLYLGLGILFEYVLKIPMGFYSIPIVVIFMVGVMIACFQNRALNFTDKLKVMAEGVGDSNIMIMILIFIVAGIFVGVTGRSSAEAVAYCMLSVTPAWAASAVMFVAACFVSLSMGTSCGTISLLAPIAVAVSEVSGINPAYVIACVVGGAMFGDNLSFISDTTIAACSTQGCEMKDKFRANFKIALPAAIAAIILIIVTSMGAGNSHIEIPEYNMLLLIPYVLVLVGGLIGWNVFVVLLVGIVSGSAITLLTGTTKAYDLLVNMGSGASGMFETVMVTILVAAMCALVREYGGFESILAFIRRNFKGRIGGRLGVGLLVGAMDISTANNTVAIVMAAPIAKEISEEYGISPKETASLLDTFSCIFQGVIPYGAQILLAISAASALGVNVSAFEILPHLYYPMLLLVSSLAFIIVPALKGSEEK